MQTLDFARSFITWRVDTLKKPPTTVSHKPPFTLNNARVQIDCRCTIVDRRAGSRQTFYLGASCKTERVGVERDIWTEPNADFIPVMSLDLFLAIKTFDLAGKQVPFYPASLGMQPERQIGRVADLFESARIDLRDVDGEVLETPRRVVEATLQNRPLVARTEIGNDRYTAVMEYPIKTMNANERDTIYQPDTGPMLYPDLSREPDDLLAGVELAFAAFNLGNWIELLVRVPTTVADGIQVYHYARSIRLEAYNQVIQLAD